MVSWLMSGAHPSSLESNILQVQLAYSRLSSVQDAAVTRHGTNQWFSKEGKGG